MLHEKLCRKVLFNEKFKVVVKPESKLFRDRLAELSEFLEYWNSWRDFYFDAKPIAIKTKSQLTTCENIVKKIEEQNYNMTLFIACVHKGFQHRKFRPEFTAALHYGDEYYEKFYDAVLGDIQLKEYENNA